MSLRIWNPLVELARFNDNFMNIFEPFSLSLDEFFAPATDVTETKDGFEIQMNIPGIKSSELTVEATSEILEIKAESKLQKIDENKESENTRRKSLRRYYKKIHFNVPIDPNTGKVTLKDGVLAILIQKKPEAKRISLNIE